MKREETFPVSVEVAATVSFRVLYLVICNSEINIVRHVEDVNVLSQWKSGNFWCRIEHGINWMPCYLRRHVQHGITFMPY